MAKKRRKPHGRPRTSATGTASSGVRIAERPEPAGRSAADATDTRGSAAQRARAEKKELARRQREEVRRRVRRAQRLRQLVWITGGAAAISLAVFWILRPDEPGPRPDTLPGELATQAPWDANAGEALERGDLIGLPAEGTTMHEHANVQVFVHGEKQPVPTDIGIDPSAGSITSVHTHDDTGTVHLESSVSREFTLDEFFGVWGVRFTPSCLGAYCNDDTNRLQVFVDGEEVTGDLQGVQLDDQSVVVVTYGTADELPDPIPSTFDFSSVPQ
jgi:hypothetical protein